MSEGAPSTVLLLCSRVQVEGFCLRWLLYTFGDMWVTVTTEAKRAAFCNLCPAAVELWMGSDQLAGVENEVAVLVTLWHAGQQVCKRRKEKKNGLGRGNSPYMT
eukprot:712500-Pelagomonas_calceolata.AAC.4